VLITHADDLPALHERWGVQMETVRKH
jgi:hypothetical protein